MSSVVPHPEGSPEFKFGDADGNQPQSILQVAEMKSFIVQYKDSSGKDQVQLAFRVPGSDMTFVLKQLISGTKVITDANPWFHKAFVEKLRVEKIEDGPSSEAVESV